MDIVRSRRHPAVQRLKSVREGREKGLVFVEGIKLAEELAASSWKIHEHYFTPSSRNDAVVRRLDGLNSLGTPLSPDVMDFVSDLETPPGLIVLAERPRRPWPPPVREGAPPLYVVLDRIQNPSNAGAVIRAAEAAGAGAVLGTPGGADLYGPKTLRAAAGSAFRLPLFMDKSPSEWAAVFAGEGVARVAADPRGEMSYLDWDWTRPTAVFLGSEGRGFQADIGPIDARLRVPMEPPVESLNVAVTAGILLFEARRRRGSLLRLLGDGLT